MIVFALLPDTDKPKKRKAKEDVKRYGKPCQIEPYGIERNN
jgi:hypothetical protein